MKKYKHISYDVKNNIAYVSIKRPHGNKINAATLKELHLLLTQIADSDLSGVIFWNAQDFSTGHDLKELASLTFTTAKEYSRLGQETFLLLGQIEKPVIAAINGTAFGPGFELALACDARLASNTALLSHPSATIGLTPAFGGTVRLSHLVGKSVAENLIKTGKKITAQEGHQIGVIDYLVDKKNLLEEAERFITTEDIPKAVYRRDDFYEEREAFSRCYSDPTTKARIRKKIR